MNTEAFATKIRAQRYWIAAALSLLLTGWIWSKQLPQNVIQPDMWDEASRYLGPAIRPLNEWNFLSDESPVYLVWYRILSWFQKDPLELYYLNGRLLIVLLALSSFFFGKRLGLGVFGSYTAGILILLFPPLVTDYRWPTEFATILLLIGFGAIVRRKSEISFFSGMTLIMLATSGVRPEFLFGVMGAVASLFFMTLRSFKQLSDKQKREALICLNLGFLGIFYWIGFVTLHPERQFIALKFFTMIRYQGTELLSKVGAVHLFSHLYGPAKSFLSALHANPKEMAAHLWFNFFHLWATLIRYAGTYRYLFIFPFGFLVAGFFAIFRWLPFFRGSIEGGSEFPSSRIFPLIILGLGPVLIGCCMAGTLPRYLLPCVVTLCLAVAWKLRSSGVKSLSAFAIIALVCVMGCAPRLSTIRELRPYVAHDSFPRQTVDQIASILYLRALHLNRAPRILATGGHPWVFVGKDATGTEYCGDVLIQCPREDEKNLRLEDFFQEHLSVDVVFWGPDLQATISRQANGGLKEDWGTFAHSPEKFGFKKFDLPCSNAQIMVKAEDISPGLSEREISKSVSDRLSCGEVL